MDQDNDFTALRELLASTRLDMPQDTQIDQFLTEFHRRQRAQLLVPQSMWARSGAWIKERFAGLALLPSLSYAGAAAAVAIAAVVSLSQQVQVTHSEGQSKLAFRMPARDASFAMVPVSLGLASPVAPKVTEVPNFAPARNDSSATRYVLANNSHRAYDATVAF